MKRNISTAFAVLFLLCLPIFAQNLLDGNFKTVTSNPSGTSANQTGKIKVKELAANGSNFISFRAPDSLAADIEWKLPSADSSGVFKSDGAGNITIGTAGVTSVGLSLPNIFTISNSPVTSTGTLTGSFATQSANQVFAGPTSGGAATPAFRALVTADLPAGTGTVTSVGLSMPADFTVASSPVTTSGTLTVTRNPAAALFVKDDFFNGSATAPISELGWTALSSGSGGVNGTSAIDINHPGILNITSSSTSNSSGGIALGNATTQLFRLDNNSGWQAVFYFQNVTATSTIVINVGFTTSTSNSSGAWMNSQGMYLRYDSSADSTYVFACKDGSGTSTQDSTINADTAVWHKVTISSSSNGTISFQLDNGTVKNISNNVSTSSLRPFFAVQSLASSAARVVYVDYFNMFIPISR